MTDAERIAKLEKEVEELKKQRTIYRINPWSEISKQIDERLKRIFGEEHYGDGYKCKCGLNTIIGRSLRKNTVTALNI